MLGMAGTSSVIPIQMSFTAAGFGPGAPDELVSGTFISEAASITSPTVPLTSISLSIGGHTYSLSELGFVNSSIVSRIYGLANSLGTLCGACGNDNFGIRWFRDARAPSLFVYTTAGIGTFFLDLPYDQISVTTEVHEPSTLAFFATGLAGLGFMGWRRRT
jgi:hypothetical protein